MRPTHAFGKALAKDMGVGAKETDTSLRTTIDVLAASLSAAGTRVVACYNYTAPPSRARGTTRSGLCLRPEGSYR